MTAAAVIDTHECRRRPKPGVCRFHNFLSYNGYDNHGKNWAVTLAKTRKDGYTYESAGGLFLFPENRNEKLRCAIARRPSSGCAGRGRERESVRADQTPAFTGAF